MWRVTMRIEIDGIEADKPLIYKSEATHARDANENALRSATRRINRQGWTRDYSVDIVSCELISA